MEEKEILLQNITQRLRMVYKSVQAHSKVVEKQCGLSSAQLGMLNEISTTPGLKVSQLAAALTIHTSTCSNMLDKLEAKGLISRDRPKNDQRSVYIYSTDAGKKLLESAPKPVQGRLTFALEQLDEKQLKSLFTSLDNLIDALNLTDDIAGMTPISE